MNHFKEDLITIKEDEAKRNELKKKDTRARERFETEFEDLDDVKEIKKLRDSDRQTEINYELNLLLRSMVKSSKRFEIPIDGQIAGYFCLYLSQDIGLKIPWKIGFLNLLQQYGFQWSGWGVGRYGKYTLRKNSLKVFRDEGTKLEFVNSIHFSLLKVMPKYIDQKKLDLFLKYLRRSANIWNERNCKTEKKKDERILSSLGRFRSWSNEEAFDEVLKLFMDKNENGITEARAYIDERKSLEKASEKLYQELHETNKPFRIVLEMQSSNVNLD